MSASDSSSLSFLRGGSSAPAGRGSGGRGRVSRGRGGRGRGVSRGGRGRAGRGGAAAAAAPRLPEPAEDGDAAVAVERLRALPLSLSFHDWFDRLMLELGLEPGVYFAYAEGIMADEAEPLGERAGRVVEFLASTRGRPVPRSANLVNVVGERWVLHRDRDASRTQQQKEEAHRQIVAQTQESLAELVHEAEQETIAKAERAERARVNAAFAAQYDMEELSDDEDQAEAAASAAAPAGGGEGAVVVVRGKEIPVGVGGAVYNNNRMMPKIVQAEEREALRAKHAEKVAKDKLDLAKDRALKMERKQRARERSQKNEKNNRGNGRGL